jgi:hypothetical protein
MLHTQFHILFHPPFQDVAPQSLADDVRVIYWVARLLKQTSSPSACMTALTSLDSGHVVS